MRLNVVTVETATASSGSLHAVADWNFEMAEDAANVAKEARRTSERDSSLRAADRFEVQGGMLRKVAVALEKMNR